VLAPSFSLFFSLDHLFASDLEPHPVLADWSEIMSAFMKVLPSPGLKLATICGCGSGANENAFKLAFIHKVIRIFAILHFIAFCF
jgi:4-aminobutyrate aminotransferase-like enzyme